MTDAAPVILDRLDQLKTLRQPYEQQWQDQAEIMRPVRAEFTSKLQPGQDRMTRIFDGTPMAAAINLGAGIFGAACNPTDNWMGYESEFDELNEMGEVKEWCEGTTQDMHNIFASRGNAAYSEIYTALIDTVVHGPGIVYADERPADQRRDQRFFFACRPLSECFMAVDHEREIDTLYRMFEMSAREAVQQFTDYTGKLLLPDGSKARQLAVTRPHDKVMFCHAVEPNREYQEGLLGPRGKAFTDCYLELDTKLKVEERPEEGYHEFPYAVFRWGGDTRDPYGAGAQPGAIGLPDAKMLQKVSKADILGVELAVDPVKLALDKYRSRQLAYHPGKTIYGGLDTQGRQLVQAFDAKSRVDWGLNMEEQRRQAVREAFLWSLMLMVMQPNMTATEWLGRQEERLRVLAPNLVQIQAGLDKLLDRVFNCAARGNWLRVPPPVMQQNWGLKVRYVSPLARAAKTQQAAAISRSWMACEPIFKVVPSAMDVVDADDNVRTIFEANGAGAKATRDKKVVDKIRADRAQQQLQAQRAAMAAEVVPALAGAAKDAAGAASQMRGAA